jgi:hypothetical protein
MYHGHIYTPAYGALGFATDTVIAFEMTYLLHRKEIEYERYVLSRLTLTFAY